MNFEGLWQYYLDRTSHNLLYPVRPEDLHKTTKSRITIKGLECLNELKRKCIMGKNELTDQETANLIYLMRIYATTNHNLDALKEHDEFLFRFCRKVDLLHHKITLYKNGYVEKNKEYDPKYYKFHTIWRDVILAEIHRQRIKEFQESF